MRIPLLLSVLALAAALPAPALAQDVPFVPIGGVQGPVADGDTGTAHRSPLAPPSGNGSSSAFVTTRGVVRQRIVTRTAAGEPNYGFFLQSTGLTADEDPLSSDGIFVFMGRFTTLIGGYEPRVGDEIVVRARVAEFFNLTELTSASLVDLVRSEVDLEVEVPATELDPPDDLAAAGRYWERREGIFASVPADALAISGRDVFASTLDGEAWVMRGDHPLAERRRAYERRSFRDAHPLDNHPRPLFDDGNGYRILLGSLGLKGASGDSAALIDPVRTFDRIRRPVAGGVYYGFGKYSVQIGEQPARAAGANPARNVPPRAPGPREYSVANYNVENLYDFRDDPGDGCDFTGNSGCEGVSPPFDYVPASLEQYEAKLADQAQQIARDLKRPDIVLVQEAEDQDLCRPVGDELACDGGDGRPDTLQELAQAIRLRFGVAYAAASDRDGADDRGIVSGFLYRTGRVRLEEATAGDPVLGSSPAVDYRAPGLGYNTQTENPKVLNAELPADVDRSTGIDGDAVFTRPPQVARFRVWRDRVGRGSSQELVAISNHFSSTPDGRVGQRTEQARYGAAIVNALGGRARVVFGGDLNVFPRPDDPFAPGQELFPSDQLAALYDDAGLTNLFDRLVRELPASAYTYVFQGQAQTLDHQFVSRRLARDLREVRVAHINADWPKDHDGDEARGASDHDPVVSRYRFAPAAADATRRAQPVTVMTYNIHHAQGADDVLDLERVASVVRDQRWTWWGCRRSTGTGRSAASSPTRPASSRGRWG